MNTSKPHTASRAKRLQNDFQRTFTKSLMIYEIKIKWISQNLERFVTF